MPGDTDPQWLPTCELLLPKLMSSHVYIPGPARLAVVEKSCRKIPVEQHILSGLVVKLGVDGNILSKHEVTVAPP